MPRQIVFFLDQHVIRQMINIINLAFNVLTFLFVNVHFFMKSLLKRYKSGTVCSTDTWSTVLNRFVCQREFTQIMSNHFRFDFNLYGN